MNRQPVRVSQVLDDKTGEAVALEIVANDGKVYFVSADPFWEGLRVGPFPNTAGGLRLARAELMRLEHNEQT